jgi:hypothetical protein
VTRRDRDDDAIRAAFEHLRVADRREAPSFDAVLQRRQQSSPVRPPWRSLAIAAVLVLVAGVTYRASTTRRERLTVPKEVVALSAWRPATDVLLETPVRNLLRETPQLGSSLINSKITGELR